MFNKRYHLIAEGNDADSLKALRIFEDHGLEYVLTLVDKCPNYFYYLKEQYSVDKLPLIFQYGDNSFSEFVLIGGTEELLQHVEDLFG